MGNEIKIVEEKSFDELYLLAKKAGLSERQSIYAAHDKQVMGLLNDINTEDISHEELDKRIDLSTVECIYNTEYMSLEELNLRFGKQIQIKQLENGK